MQRKDVCLLPDIQSLGHAFGKGVQAAAIGPLGLCILEWITLLNVSLAIEGPDGLSDIDQVGQAETPGDQGVAYRATTLDVLCAMIVDEALPLPGSCSTAYAVILFEYGYCIACVA